MARAQLIRKKNRPIFPDAHYMHVRADRGGGGLDKRGIANLDKTRIRSFSHPLFLSSILKFLNLSPPGFCHIKTKHPMFLQP